eukprot:1528624-Amphidinium_carterae.2
MIEIHCSMMLSRRQADRIWALGLAFAFAVTKSEGDAQAVERNCRIRLARGHVPMAGNAYCVPSLKLASTLAVNPESTPAFRGPPANPLPWARRKQN